VERRHRCDLAVRAALIGFLIVRATFWCRLCTRPSPPAQSRVQRRRPPPRVVAGRRRCYVAACQRSRVIRAVGSRSDGPGLTPLPLNPHASTVARSRSNRSRSSQPRVNRPNPAGPGVFAEKTLRFPEFTKIPFHLRSFLKVQTFFFILAHNLFKSLQISPYTFPKP
jgi:hypothetical protein